MFVVGIPLVGELFFMYATMLIAVPTGVKVFNWVSTMWQGSLTFETPMLFAVAFVILFTIGGFSGLMLAIAPADFQYHDTYFVVAHFHYVLVPGDLRHLRLGLLLAAEMDRPHVRRNPRQAALLAVVHRHEHGLLPMHFVGLAGMPRRIPDYNLQFADFNMVSSIGAFMFGATQIFFLFIVIKCIRGGAPAPAKPWDGAEGLSGRCPRRRPTTPSRLRRK
jgi:cytochrome c oxidase subunit 1